MLKSHFDAVEESLLAIAKVPANSGHPLHKGTPREAFIRTFLEGHLSESVAVGTGEIIDAHSKPRDQRNQHDIVIYRRSYPRLDFGGEINGFLAESVVATIEVKSTLEKGELQKAMRAAKAVKALQRNVVTSLTAGYQPPTILSYVVAYDGPASIETVYGWLPQISDTEGIVYPEIPASDEARLKTASPSLDGVFILGKGFIHFGNAPVGFFRSEARSANTGAKWAIGETPCGSLLLLFVLLTVAVSGTTVGWLDPMPYLKSFSVEKCRLGE